MKPASYVCVVIAFALGACTKDSASTRATARGEPVGVNSVAATTPSGPSPSEMATTAVSGTKVDTRSSIDAGMGTSGSTSSSR
jgi:hypothetical protein